MKNQARPPIKAAATALLALCLFSAHAVADPGPTQVLADDWATTVYQMPEEAQRDRLSALYERSRQAIATDSDNPALLTWGGIIAATYAGAKGGLGALSLAKRARRDLERAMAIDPEALDGGARASLGTLYAKVPGWPLGFGDTDMAEALLRESAERHPDNASAQFFYAEFLSEQGQHARARQVLEAARDIPIRDGARVADTGRQAQIRDLLERLPRSAEDSA